MKLRVILMAVAAAAGVWVGPAVQTAVAVPCIPSVTISDAGTVEEKVGKLAFTVILSDPLGCVTNGSAQYKTVVPLPNGKPDASPVSDYVPKSGTLHWTQFGPSVSTIEIPVLMDQFNEPNEEIGLVLFNPSGVRITDGDAMGIVESTPICLVPEGPDSLAGDPPPTCSVQFELPEPARTSVTVVYSTIDGTARAGEDFVGVRDARVTIPAGAIRAELVVETRPNSPGEPDERFDFQLGATSGNSTESDRTTITIRSAT